MFKNYIYISMAFVSLFFSGLLIINYPEFTEFEMVLLTGVGILLIWFLSETLRRHHHQRELIHLRKKNEELILNSQHTQRLAQQAQSDSENMIGELRAVQELLKEIVQERIQHKTVEDLDHTNLSNNPKKFDHNSDQNSDQPEDKDNVIDSEQQQIIGLAELPEDHLYKTHHKTLSREQLLVIVEDALRRDRIEMLMQPIVSLPQRKVRHFECFSRIRGQDNEILTPAHFLPLAEEKRLIRLVDNAILFRCIQIIRRSMKKKVNVNFFINVSKYTVGDDFFFNSLLEFLIRNRELTPHMIFEFKASDLQKSQRVFDDNLRKLRLFECACSLDHITTPHLDFAILKSLNFKYLKIHTPAFLKLTNQECEAFKGSAKLHNMDIIASHLETENELREINDFDPDFGQGFLFGPPVLNRKL